MLRLDMLYLNQLGISYGSRVLFENVSLRLNPKHTYGITGANGSGKSTLLKILSNQELASSGNIECPKNATIGFLQQDHFKYEQLRILDVVIAGKPSLAQALQEKAALLAQETLSDAEGMRLAELELTIAEHDGYSAESVAEQILMGLGLVLEKHQQPLSSLSGGFKLRVLMAQCLFRDPDILLLDEPTNHLDIVAIHWLEQFLTKQYKGVLLVVSHDKAFLNAITTDILDVDYQTITAYKGNFDAFVKAKELAYTQREIEQKEAQRKIAHLQSFVDKNRAKASKASLAQSRLKMIERIDVPELLTSSRGAPNFKFLSKRPSGKTVVTLKNIHKSFGELTVLNRVGFTVNRGEKVAIIGPNGIGKSTLLKIMLDKITPEQGSVEWGHETHVSYFAQDHKELLQQSQSILNWLREHAVVSEERVLRGVLGNMLFTKDDANKDIRALSGGEAARVLFSEMMLAQNNVLVLDEPTNHLDMETIEALGSALKAYPGTVILVSHDRHFIHQCCNRVIGISHDEVVDYDAHDSDDLNNILELQFSSCMLMA